MTQFPVHYDTSHLQSDNTLSLITYHIAIKIREIQGGSNMTGTDLCVNKPHCAAAVRP